MEDTVSVLVTRVVTYSSLLNICHQDQAEIKWFLRVDKVTFEL